MTKNLVNRIEKMQESINKDLVELNNKLTETNNTITEIKNTLEEINSRIFEAEECKSGHPCLVLDLRMLSVFHH